MELAARQEAVFMIDNHTLCEPVTSKSQKCMKERWWGWGVRDTFQLGYG